MEPSENAYDIGFKSGNMCFNQFCIDENAAFELIGVHYFKDSDKYYSLGDKSKGKKYKKLILNNIML